MFKYSRYLLSYVFRKKIIYAIPLVLFLVFNWATMSQISRTNELGFEVINSLSTFNLFIPFVFMGAFSSVIVIYTFKDPQLDGSDLLILSKPISRAKMIFSKFFVTYFFIILYAIVTFTNFSLLGLYDKVAVANDALAPLKFGLSLSGGGLIISFILTSIIIMVSTRFGKIGTLIFSVAFVPVIPIFSFIISTNSGGLPRDVEFLRNRSYRLSSKESNLDKLSTIQKDFRSFLDKNDKKIYYLLSDSEDKKLKENFKEYKKESWYQDFSYVDVWYQWSRFFSLFVTQNRFTRTNVKNFVSKEFQVVKENANEPIIIGKEEYIFFISENEIAKESQFFSNLQPSFQNASLGKSTESLQNLIQRFQWLRNYLKPKKDFSFSQVSAALEYILDTFEGFPNSIIWPGDLKNANDDQIWKIITKKAPSSIGIILYNTLLKNENENSTSVFSNIFQDLKIKKANSLFLKDDLKGYKNKVENYLVKNGSSIEIAKDTDFISTVAIVSFWSSIAFFAIVVAFAFYFKRDFK